MKIVPYEQYEFTTLIPIDEAKRILEENCERFSFRSFHGQTNKEFWGYTDGNNFKIYRAIRYRNSFLPIIHGKLIENGGKTKVVTIFRMPIFAIIFFMLGLSFSIFGLIATALESDGKKFIFSIIVFLLFYGITQGGFWFEVPKAKKHLNEMFKYDT